MEPKYTDNKKPQNNAKLASLKIGASPFQLTDL